MPGLELTLPQASRLWGLGVDDCRFVVDALVDAGFLAWTARRTVVRRGGERLPRRDEPQHISVLLRRRQDRTVGR